MNLKNILLFSLLLCLSASSFGQKKKTDAHIIGHVVDQDKNHIAFGTVLLEGTTIGTATDETGHFRMLNLPEGSYTVVFQALGYKSYKEQVEVKAEQTVELKVILQEDLIGLEQVVVSANRNEQNRKEAVTVVNALTPQIFQSTQSVTIGEGLNFTPGLRLENNCQNCGFTQVRMNGMEGPYSQVLINSRPIFSGLAGVYGLELFPASMVERIEVVRGGGSALFGSNAIAGTINLITKDPIKNSFEVGVNSSLTGLGVENGGSAAWDNSVNFNAAIVGMEAKSGIVVYGFARDRDAYDANNDGYTELSTMKNTTVGTRAYHRTGKNGKITVDYFNIREDRRGGNKLDYIEHEADIAESIQHNINTGAVQYDQFFAQGDKLSVYGSVQNVDRATYYGAKEEENGEPDLSAYGQTDELSYAVGTQYYLDREKFLFAPGNLVAGIESNGSALVDQKLGYYDFATATMNENNTVADQHISIVGAFAQAEWQISRLKASVGARFDHYSITDNEAATGNNSGNVLSPRVSLKYEIVDGLQFRTSYSQGYRAPQVFDEDLHIEVSGARKVLHQNEADLEQENSRSFMASFDIEKMLGKIQNQFLVEGFYTALDNPFTQTLTESATEAGTFISVRSNETEGAHVYGANLEWNVAPTKDLVVKLGYTAQVSEYKAEQEIFEEGTVFEKSFLRTPNNYGFVNLDYDAVKNLCLSVSGTYTGSMLVPYGDGAEGKLNETDTFFDLGAKLAYDVVLNGTKLQFSAGIKNVLNSYQSDFDSGLNRDPGYIYGPLAPRTIYFGIKFFNF